MIDDHTDANPTFGPPTHALLHPRVALLQTVGIPGVESAGANGKLTMRYRDSSDLCSFVLLVESTKSLTVPSFLYSSVAVNNVRLINGERRPVVSQQSEFDSTS